MDIVTLELLAGVYRGGRANLKVALTHSHAMGDEKTLCRSIPADHLVDTCGATDLNAPPTCLRCLKKDPRFRG